MYKIKKVLSKIIHSDQTGFLKGRCIGENIVKMLKSNQVALTLSIKMIELTCHSEEAKLLRAKCEGRVMELGGICPWITGQKHEDSDTPPLLLYSDSFGSKAT